MVSHMHYLPEQHMENTIICSMNVIPNGLNKSSDQELEMHVYVKRNGTRRYRLCYFKTEPIPVA